MKKMMARLSTGLLLVLVMSVCAHADEVTDWNEAMLRAGLVAGTSPTTMTRMAALVQVAVFDAVNGIEPRYTYFHVSPAGAPFGASRRAAAVQAAYAMLTRLFGSQAPTPNAAQQAILEARRTVSLGDIAKVESAASIASGITWGQFVADQIFAWRAGDGFSVTAPFPDSLVVGEWRRTPNLPVSAALSVAGAGYVSLSQQLPWALPSPSAFRPGPPPPITSTQYATDFNEVKLMGSHTSPVRSHDQTTYALFWNGATVSYLWNRAALSLVEQRNGARDDRGQHSNQGGKHSNQGRDLLLDNARMFGQLTVAMADAIIGCWDAKYTYAYWRPITAIRDPSDDGNAATASDPTWMPLFATPGHPEYPSGHSCASGAAAAVLAQAFGESIPIDFVSDVMLGVTRRFHGPAQALEEVKNARIFSGIHFRTACDVGTELGNSVAHYVLQHKFQKLD